MHKTRFFLPGYAELEPSASYLASSSGASAFLCLNRQALSSIYQKLTLMSSPHMAPRKNAVLPARRSGVRAQDKTNILLKKFFSLHQNAGHYHQRPLKLS
jgi:hypothetical protein